MYILDTNVLSAMMRSEPVPQVADWVAGQQINLLYTVAVCQAEILSGLAIMPDGRRRHTLETAARAMFLEDFEGRVLRFDMAAAVAYGEIFAARRRVGRPVATLDLMVAAVARAHRATVVTRDIPGFADCGVTVINPWAAAG